MRLTAIPSKMVNLLFVVARLAIIGALDWGGSGTSANLALINRTILGQY